MAKKKATPTEGDNKDYIPEIWKEYTIEELMWWVINLTRRATHRLNKEKALEDIENANNYLWMMSEAVKEEIADES